ncbi:MAG TPA: TIGR03560 family F420-dependent LLM class oxidoreductase [Actinomycetota bacterium]|jgi:F420-dependent oxidoreductase-like protein|nr:TIGR03560 family F420-dependent LLM class oxidoreductase [Actinomycetota bacterium]
MRVCLMIEGQEDVTWEQWLALAGACEEHGLEGLFRSDHYQSVMGVRQRGSLDAWATLSALAARTSRIRLGTLVSPATFRHPSVLAKTVVTVDHVSGGRVELGLGAGWHEGEHRAYGFEFPPTPIRMERLAEQLEIVTRSWTEDGFDFQGRHYQVQDLRALPKPVQRPRPTLLVGGGAGPRSLALAARYADEYNTLGVPLEELAERRRRLLAAWGEAGRDSGTARLSLMTTCVVGRDRAEVEERVGRVMAVTGSHDSVAEVVDARPHWLLGTVDEVADRLRALEAAGVSRVMLQHLDHADVEMVAVLGELAATMDSAP